MITAILPYMSAHRNLILIGYWRNENVADFPDPHDFVDLTWDEEERRKVIAHLKAGIPMPYAAGGYSWCRFSCGQNDLGSLEFSDGVYIWPEGLPHYLEKHGVRLPDPIVRHMLNNGNKNIEEELKSFPEGYTINTDWWKVQKV